MRNCNSDDSVIMRITGKKFFFRSNSLEISARESPWDTESFGFKVAQVDSIRINKLEVARLEYCFFNEWIHVNNYQVVSCRLQCSMLNESMLLEENGFRFVETVLHPYLDSSNKFKGYMDNELIISTPDESELPELRSIAETAFTNERYYADPRINSSLSGIRFGNWLVSSYYHKNQILLKASHNNVNIAFFIIENLDDSRVYWHLTAVSPRFQGMGYGRRIWGSMIARHFSENKKYISTTIAARNVTVLNLYSSFGFRFSPPEMTFHWVNDAKSLAL